MKALSISVGSQKISAKLIYPESLKSKNPALIFIHGWGSDQIGNIERAKELSKLGFVCLTLDLRGHGGSDGSIDQYSREDHIQDIKTAYKYLTKLKEVNQEKIGIIGSSYGAYLAAVAANFLEFEWIILRVPALYYDKDFDTPTTQLIGRDRNAFTTAGLDLKNSLALKAAANFPGEILIIESGKDKIISHSVIQNYLEVITDKRRLSYIVMKETGHSLETQVQEKEYVDILKTWILEKSAELEIEI